MKPIENRADAANNVQNAREALASAIANGAIDYEKNCIVCGLLTGKLCPKDHKYISGCEAAKHLRERDWNRFKMLCDLPRDYTYCLFCWFPQKKLRPHYHVADNYASRTACNLRDICCLLVWIVFKDSSWKKRVCEKFPVMRSFGTEAEYASWLVKLNEETRFVNALHVVREVLITKIK